MEIYYALFVFSIFLNCASSIFGGFYNKKIEGLKNTSSLYSFLKLAAIFAFWFVRFAIDGFALDAGVLLYSLVLSVCFFGGVYGFISALKTGSNVISTLMLNVSSIIVSIWGIIFWDQPLTTLVVLGLILVIVAVFLCLYKGKEEDKKASLSWLMYLAITFFGNAGCGIIMKEQQIAFNNLYSPFFMMTAIGICTIAAFLMFYFGDRSDAKELIKRAWYFPVVEGLCNALMNMISLILLTTSLSINVLYPVRGVITLMLVTMFSALIFKERMKWWQWIGVAVGIAAVGILSI
ncbi:MAG: hypothetical protein IJC72_00385 [Clostridia bacterium]|nr:hypothetical protein [Clostridia bacterium]